jgi:hypothetical protein
MAMHEYTLRPAQDGFELRGGRLEEPLIFLDRDIDIPVRMVGFLTCYTGGLLRRYDEDGLLVAERRFPGGEFQQTR